MPDDVDAPSREATAYHEAGHAVMSVKLGIPVHSCTIVPGADRFGETGADLVTDAEAWASAGAAISAGEIDDYPDALRSQAERDLMALLAGDVAEALHLSGPEGRGGGVHRELIEQLISPLCCDPEESDAYETYLRLRVRSRLSSPPTWRGVENVAQLLLQRGTITGAEISDAVQAAQQAWADAPW